jgi:hypothetical protein
MFGPGTESTIASLDRRLDSVSRYESTAHDRTIRHRGSNRCGRSANVRVPFAPEVCVRICRIDASGSAVSILKEPTLSSSDNRRSSSQRINMAAVNTCVSPSALKGVSVLVAMALSRSW